MFRFVYDGSTGGVQKVMKPVDFSVDLEIPKVPGNLLVDLEIPKVPGNLLVDLEVPMVPGDLLVDLEVPKVPGDLLVDLEITRCGGLIKLTDKGLIDLSMMGWFGRLID